MDKFKFRWWSNFGQFSAFVENYFWSSKIICRSKSNFWWYRTSRSILKFLDINSSILNEHFTLLIQFVSVQFIMNTSGFFKHGLTFLSKSWLYFKTYLNFFSFFKIESGVWQKNEPMFKKTWGIHNELHWNELYQ